MRDQDATVPGPDRTRHLRDRFHDGVCDGGVDSDLDLVARPELTTCTSVTVTPCTPNWAIAWRNSSRLNGRTIAVMIFIKAFLNERP